jgi:predicted transcriptional regulator
VTLIKIKELLKAKILFESIDKNIDIKFAKASDLMSDVLAFSQPYSEANTILITGLTNKQVVRTCEIAGVCVIVFVRGKNLPAETIELAKECKIPILSTKLKMFEACGILFSNGIRPASSKKSK